MWAIAVGLDIASKKILAGNENGCDKLSGELVPLEHFNYTNLKLGCVLKQSFSEVNFLGITVSYYYDKFYSSKYITYRVE